MAYDQLFDFGAGEEPDLAVATKGEGGDEYDVADASGGVPARSPSGLATKIKEVAGNLGISPEDLATAISYESEGTFSPKIMGGAGGNYMGLIQFGPEERKRYGADSKQTAVEQMDAVERYLKDRGVKPGMGMLDVYSTINAGSPGRYNASDANNGGAPGTVRDKVEKQMADHRAAAQRLLADAAAVGGSGGGAAAVDRSGGTGITIRPAGQQLPPIVVDEEPQERPVDLNLFGGPNDETVPVAPVSTVPQKAPINGAEAAAALQALLDQPKQELKDQEHAPGQVANQGQGLAGQMDLQPNVQPLTETPIPPTMEPGLLASATAPVPEPLKDGFITKLIKETGNQIGQTGRGVAEAAQSISNIPNAVGGLLTKPVAMLGIPGAQEITDQFSRNFAANQKIPEKIVPVPDPVNIGQQLSRNLGNMAVPGQPLMTAFMTGAATVGQNFFTPAQAKSNAKKEHVGRDIANQILATPETTPHMFGPAPGPRVTHTVDNNNPVVTTAGGPLGLGGSEWGYLGWMGVMTVGALFAPKIFKAIAAKALPGPKPRDVAFAQPGTVTSSDLLSYMRTGDDQYAGLMRDLRRMGAPLDVVEDLTDNFRIQMGSTADRLANSAISTGRMETPTFSFKGPALNDVAKVEQADPDLAKFINAKSAVRMINEIDTAKPIPSTASGKAKQAAAGPTTVNGLTAVQAQQFVNDLNKARPDLKPAAQAYSDFQREVNRFLTDGEYATHLKYNKGDPKKPSFKQSNVVNHPDVVPYMDVTGSTKILTEPNVSAPPQVDSPSLALRENTQRWMRNRMKNEVTGLFIDKSNQYQPGTFMEVPKEEYNNQSTAERNNTVKLMRRGEAEYYTADPFYVDILKMDPYYITGTMSSVGYMAKRATEIGTTGALQPLFAITSMIRNHKLARLAVEDGRSAPWSYETVAAVPQQLLPQVAKYLSQKIDGQGWLRGVLGDQTADALALTWAKRYTDSYFYEFEKAGTARGTYLEQQAQIKNTLTEAFAETPQWAKNFGNAYMELIGSMHNAPAFAFAVKNKDKAPITTIMKESRALTGDNSIGGRYYNNIGQGQPLRRQGTGTSADIMGEWLAKKYLGTTEIGRTIVPWWNATTQGIKAVGDQYMRNPNKFIARLYMYEIAPAAAVYLWNRGLGYDENGQSYVDYMMHGRSEYNRQMNTYIGIPGRPAERGVHIPRVQEFSMANRMAEDTLHHLSYSQVFQNSEDFLRSAGQAVGAPDIFPKNNGAPYYTDYTDLVSNMKGAAQAVFEPSMPPLLNMPFAANGMQTLGGPLSGDTFNVKPNPYDSNKGMNENIDAILRAALPGFGDVLGAGYAAFHRTPEGFLASIGNGIKAATKKEIQKGPVLRSLLNMDPPPTGNTKVTEDLFAQERVINQLSKFFRANDPKYGAGLMSIRPISNSGNKVADKLTGGMPSAQSAGLDQLPPKNELYKQFMLGVYEKFNTDAEQSGGIGFKSIWKRYGMAQTVLKTLRQVDDGNNARWLEGIQGPQKGQVEEELSKFGVHTDDIRSVREFYQRRQQAVAKQLLFTINAVKEELNNDPAAIAANGGKPIDWKDFDPYKDNPPLIQGPLVDNNLLAPWTDGEGTGN